MKPNWSPSSVQRERRPNPPRSRPLKSAAAYRQTVSPRNCDLIVNGHHLIAVRRTRTGCAPTFRSGSFIGDDTLRCSERSERNNAESGDSSHRAGHWCCVPGGRSYLRTIVGLQNARTPAHLGTAGSTSRLGSENAGREAGLVRTVAHQRRYRLRPEHRPRPEAGRTFVVGQELRIVQENAVSYVWRIHERNCWS